MQKSLSVPVHLTHSARACFCSTYILHERAIMVMHPLAIRMWQPLNRSAAALQLEDVQIRPSSIRFAECHTIASKPTLAVPVVHPSGLAWWNQPFQLDPTWSHSWAAHVDGVTQQHLVLNRCPLVLKVRQQGMLHEHNQLQQGVGRTSIALWKPSGIGLHTTKPSCMTFKCQKIPMCYSSADHCLL
jgi:hypothetical protein